MTASLSFGYRVPEGVHTAWGARLIVTQDGTTDFLYDRQGGDGPAFAELQEWLNGGAFKDARARAEELLAAYAMRTRESQEFVLYEDRFGRIIGNTNGSAGYLYVSAWLTAHEGSN